MMFRARKASERMGEYFSAPSFLMPEGVMKAQSPKELKEIADKGGVLIIYPFPSALIAPSRWVSAIANADYIVIIGDSSIDEFRNLRKHIDNIIFSPVARKLSGCVMVESLEEALRCASAIGDATVLQMGDMT